MVMGAEAEPFTRDQTKSPSLVSLTKVGKTYTNKKRALEGIDLDVRPGELLALLGPSGCGKSTLLRLIAGLDQPTDGTLAYDSSETPSLGYVFQDPTLMPWADVFDNVFLPPRLQGQKQEEARQRVLELLKMVGLEDFAGAYPRELSGGMRMRVSIARALVLHPKLLLMDEPFAALDEITRFRLNDDLLRLQADLRTTIVFVTHSVFESVYLANRILVMAASPGRIIAEIGIETSERGESFRSSPAYLAYCRKASEALRAAMHDGSSP
jgi:NitT/TauT family transport system ATP-binding protein